MSGLHSRSRSQEQERIRAKCVHPSGVFEEFCRTEVDQSVPARFEKIAARFSDRIAVQEKHRALTYGELNEMSNHLALSILDRCGDSNQPVAVLMEHGAAPVVAILATLKAGKIYFPLDPSYPRERLQYMLHDAGAELILAHRETLGPARTLSTEKCPVMDADELGRPSRPTALDRKTAPEIYASLFYTSGSTGEPKGVVDNHRNILDGTLRFTNGLRLCAEDRISLTHSCSSSASLRRIFPALLNGASLFPVDLKREGIPGLIDVLMHRSITFFSTGRIREFVRNFRLGQSLPSLRLVSLGGELVYRSDIEHYKKIFPPHCVIGIWFSTTETGNVTQFLIDKESELSTDVVPIGYPAPGVEVLLFGEDGKSVERGKPGEIAVRSEHLACGYWRRPELTREKFRSDPENPLQRIYYTGDLGRAEPDGCLYHLGRRDDQIKIRGYRIEPSEIEAALLNLGFFSKVFVMLRERPSGENALVAYAVPEKRPAPTTAELRNRLSVFLPSTMIPSFFVMLDQMPLTPTGKINRSAFPEPNYGRPEIDTTFVAPQTPVQKDLAKIWREVLSIDAVGIEDNFFDLGGHSLAAIRIVSRVIRTFHVDLSPKSLFSAPNVAEMAVLIEANRANVASSEKIDLLLSELEATTEEEALKRLRE